MKNVQALTEELDGVFQKLKGGEMDVKVADALANVAGKMLKANLGQLQYYDQRKETPNLPFWEKTSK